MKPHASPVFHAIQYLLGNQTLDKLRELPRLRRRAVLSLADQGRRRRRLLDRLGRPRRRGHRLRQPRPGLSHGARTPRRAAAEGRMVALVGDAELDEGNIFECLLEGWKQGLRNCWWVIDYNRQSLDAVVREGLYQRITALFEAMGWEVRVLKYGALLEAAFAEPGGEALARLDRPLPQPALLGARLPGRRRLAEAPPRRDRRPGTGLGADRAALRRRAGPADDQPRRPRPARRCSTPSRRSTTTGRSASSPTRSRASACPSRGTRTTMPA